MIIKVFFDKDLMTMSPKLLTSLSECYKNIFNTYWHESWTYQTARDELEKSLSMDQDRKTAISLLLCDDMVVGFGLVVFTSIFHIVDDDMPFDLGKKEKKQGIDTLKYWFGLAKREQVMIYKELGIIKEFQTAGGKHIASKISLPLFKIAQDQGYKTLFYWTSPHNPTYKQGISFGWHPVHYFPKNDRVIMVGSIDKSIVYLTGIDNKDRKAIREMISNYERYYHF